MGGRTREKGRKRKKNYPQQEMMQFLALLQVVCVGLGDDVTFTISGHSSGGSMASQHFVAFSDRVLGLGESINTAVLNSLK